MTDVFDSKLIICLTCPKCRYQTKYIGALVSHINSTHPNCITFDIFQCGSCDFRSTSPDLLDEHAVQDHSNERVSIKSFIRINTNPEDFDDLDQPFHECQFCPTGTFLARDTIVAHYAAVHKIADITRYIVSKRPGSRPPIFLKNESSTELLTPEMVGLGLPPLLLPSPSLDLGSPISIAQEHSSATLSARVTATPSTSTPPHASPPPPPPRQASPPLQESPLQASLPPPPQASSPPAPQASPHQPPHASSSPQTSLPSSSQPPASRYPRRQKRQLSRQRQHSSEGSQPSIPSSTSSPSSSPSPSPKPKRGRPKKSVPKKKKVSTEEASSLASAAANRISHRNRVLLRIAEDVVEPAPGPPPAPVQAAPPVPPQPPVEPPPSVQCPDCTRLFRTQSAMRIHNSLTHWPTPGQQRPIPGGGASGAAVEPPLFECPNCQRRFMRRAGLDSHLSREHNIPADEAQRITAEISVRINAALNSGNPV